MKPLHVILSFYCYDKIEASLKFNEYRRKTNYWKKRLLKYVDYLKTEPKILPRIIFHRAYTNRTMTFEFSKISDEQGMNSDLKVDEIVFDIEFKNRIK